MASHRQQDRCRGVALHQPRIRDKFDAVGRPAATKAALTVRAIQDGILAVDEL
jgi:hypothetical protein